jgi:hypothetical protein
VITRSLDFLIPMNNNHSRFAGVAATEGNVESLPGRMGESTRQVEGLFESLLAKVFGFSKSN